jgi:hypothetical protein
MTVKLTKSQHEWLDHAREFDRFSPGPLGASSCASLVRKGLLHDHYRGIYSITADGIAALSEVGSSKPMRGYPLHEGSGE